MHPLYEKANKVSAEVYEAALEVQKHFGIGLPESLYQKCLARELQLRGHSAETEVIVPIRYKGYEFHRRLAPRSFWNSPRDPQRRKYARPVRTQAGTYSDKRKRAVFRFRRSPRIQCCEIIIKV